MAKKIAVKIEQDGCEIEVVHLERFRKAKEDALDEGESSGTEQDIQGPWR